MAVDDIGNDGEDTTHGYQSESLFELHRTLINQLTPAGMFDEKAI